MADQPSNVVIEKWSSDCQAHPMEEESGVSLKGCTNLRCSRKLGQDDGHRLCLKCRYWSRGHTPCRQREEMGEFSSKLWRQFLDKIRLDIAKRDTSTGSTGSSNTDFVYQSQFKNFEE